MKESFPIIRSLYLLLIVLSISTVPSYWFFCSIAYSQEIEVEESDEDSRSDLDDAEGDSPFDVVIPENAAWSQTINERFDPSNITIPQSGEVRWTNEDNLDHTITSGNLSGTTLDGIYDGRFYSNRIRFFCVHLYTTAQKASCHSILRDDLCFLIRRRPLKRSSRISSFLLNAQKISLCLQCTVSVLEARASRSRSILSYFSDFPSAFKVVLASGNKC